jgi:hypothetical protein
MQDGKDSPGQRRRITIIALWAAGLSLLLAGLATFALVACKSGP